MQGLFQLKPKFWSKHNRYSFQFWSELSDQYEDSKFIMVSKENQQ